MSKTKQADLSSIAYFYFSSDLKIEPIIKARHDETFFVLKTTKDEDVQFINGEITVVTNEITALKSKHKEDEQLYGPNELKVEIEKIAALAKANNASLDGQVVIRDGDGGQHVFRILVVNNKVTVEEGKPAVRWPDGSTSDMPGSSR